MNAKTLAVECVFQDPTKSHSKADVLVVENALQLIVNHRKFSVTMQTPGDERYLTRGLLHSEGFENTHFIQYEQTNHEHISTVKVIIDCKKVVRSNRRLSSTASCGLCGKTKADDMFANVPSVSRKVSFSAAMIEGCYQQMASQQTLFQATGGCHAAAAFDSDGVLLALFEDIGRHNAVDKVVGFLLEHHHLDQAAILAVSSRVSFEIIQKCAQAGIPVLTAISAPSSLAVEMAKQTGITLAAFCRQGRATFYSGRMGEATCDTPC